MELPETFEAVRNSVIAFASKFVPTLPGKAPLSPAVFGTGFVVDKRGIVVTNRHVVEVFRKLPPHPTSGSPSAVAIVWSGVQKEAGGHTLPLFFVDIVGYSAVTEFSSSRPFYGEPVPDVAFVQLKVQNLPQLGLATEPDSIRTGMPVATAGFPLGTDPLVVYGKVTQLTPILRRGIVSSLYPFPCPKPHGFTIDVQIQEGASGSPVFLTDSPAVLGMLEGSVKGGPNIAVAVPSTIIHLALSEFLKENPLDLSGIPTLVELLERSERSDQLKWETFTNQGIGNNQKA